MVVESLMGTAKVVRRQDMRLVFTVLPLLFAIGSCTVKPRVHRPARVQTNAARPGDQVLAVSEPECRFEDSGQCCLTVTIGGNIGVPNCVKISQEGDNGYAAYIFNNQELVRKDLTTGMGCFRIPQTPYRACIHIYYADIDPAGREGNACMYACINQVICLDFNCMRISRGKVYHNTEHSPESEGVFNVDFVNGRKNLFIGRPIED